MPLPSSPQMEGSRPVDDDAQLQLVDRIFVPFGGAGPDGKEDDLYADLRASGEGGARAQSEGAQKTVSLDLLGAEDGSTGLELVRHGDIDARNKKRIDRGEAGGG